MNHPETIQDDPTKHICHACIGDEFLANQVKEQEAQATCSYCGERRDALTLEDFADRTDNVFREHFRLTPSGPSGYEYMLIKEDLLDWYREGESVRRCDCRHSKSER